ncbi:hypothetical protein SAY87_016335 [Trapa incisa]|uniref:Pentatricopeptide repeat-containing protein n=1 Tax=Trapa incisa TaxID=236973 RepID=A0AAN7QUA9_9MYRT|nr:hypothetical protein SAY87_016335 [Trapa incisa]
MGYYSISISKSRVRMGFGRLALDLGAGSTDSCPIQTRPEVQQDETMTLKFFYWADRQWRYRPYPIVYPVMLEILSNAKLYQRILRLMGRRVISRPLEVFLCVMISYSRAGRLRDSLRLLTLMQKVDVDPNLPMSDTVIHELMKNDQLEKACKFLERMEIVRIITNVLTYNCLIMGLCDV